METASVSNKFINQFGLLYIQVNHTDYFIQGNYGDHQITAIVSHPDLNYSPEELNELIEKEKLSKA